MSRIGTAIIFYAKFEAKTEQKLEEIAQYQQYKIYANFASDFKYIY